MAFPSVPGHTPDPFPSQQPSRSVIPGGAGGRPTQARTQPRERRRWMRSDEHQRPQTPPSPTTLPHCRSQPQPNKPDSARREKGALAGAGSTEADGVAARCTAVPATMSERMKPVDRPGNEPAGAPAQNDGAAVAGGAAVAAAAAGVVDRSADEVAIYRYLERLLNEGHERMEGDRFLAWHVQGEALSAKGAGRANARTKRRQKGKKKEEEPSYHNPLWLKMSAQLIVHSFGFGA
ncbi:hypothetical protein THAOC_21575, partial [Thalassiosira oceanica]